MNHQLFACLFFMATLFFVGCQNGADTTTGADANASTTTSAKPNHVEASFIAPFIGMWFYATPVSFDGSRDADYTGRWIEFKGDGTFTSGRWKDQDNTGKFSYDKDKQYLMLDYDKNVGTDRDLDWKIMQGAETMIWLGNTELNKTGDQIQMKRITQRPEKTVGQ